MAKIRYLGMLLLSFYSTAWARSVYVNGHDVSSAFNQQLKNVDVFIDTKGNIFITAPNYQVEEEDTYMPLSQMPVVQHPKHMPPAGIVMPKNKETPPAAAPTAAPTPSPAEELKETSLEAAAITTPASETVEAQSP